MNNNIDELLNYLSEHSLEDENYETNETAKEIYSSSVEEIGEKFTEGLTAIDVQTTLQEIQVVSARLYIMLNKNKNNPLVLKMITSLLEIKMKLLGMFNVRPEVKDLVDYEINVYKRKVMKVIMDMAPIHAEQIATRLSEEGL